MSAIKSLEDTLKPFIKMADDMESKEPVIAYCCLQYFCEQFMAAKKKAQLQLAPDEQAMLTDVMNKMGEMQKEQELTKDDRKTMLDEYCGVAFATIEKEDRIAPKITMKHAARFLEVSRLIELQSIYGALPKPWEDKRRSQLIF